MEMNDLMAPFRAVVEDRHGWIKDYAAKGERKIAGYFCDYVPEELMWAAGFAPVRITGGKGNVMAADQHMQSNVCSFARRCLDQALEGVFKYMDAVVIPHTCDAITKMYDLWAYRIDYPQMVHYLWVPHKVFDKDAVGVMLGEVKRMKKALEDLTGKEITNDEILEAVKVYDRSRELLKKVYELRQSDPPKISGEDAFTIALSSILAPKDLHIQWMEKFLEGIESVDNKLESRPRVMISASMIEDLDLIRAVEESGSWVVADDMCTGSRYFFDRVGEIEGDPLKALTTRYLNKLPCPRSVGAMKPRSEHLHSMGKDYKVDGVIFYLLRCCDAHIFQYPILNERLQKAGYKLLYIQGDQSVGINEAITNRIKAFTEMLAP